MSDGPRRPAGVLASRTALVSGASAGIGLASARALAQLGATVALCARDAGRLDEAASAIEADTGTRPATIAADLSTSNGVAAAVGDAVAALGRVDILVNVAGAAPAGDVRVLVDADWATAIELKLMGYVRLTRAVLPGMVDRGFGRIINIAGTSGLQPEGWLVSASVANAGVIALSKAVAADVAADGVTVNAVCPGPVETGRWSAVVARYAALHDVSPQAALETLLADIPSGRAANPQEVAAVVAFLAGPDAAHITGTALPVDGGQVRGT